MTRLLTLLLLIGVAAAPAWAQRPDADRAAQAIERMNLSAGTADALRSALSGAEREPGALWAVTARLSQSLTDAQRAELVAAAEARQQERAARMAERTRGQEARPERGDTNRQRADRARRAGPATERAADGMQQAHAARNAALNLTAEQQTALDALHTRHREQMVALRQSAGGDRAAMRDAMQRFRTEAEAERNRILTPEQRQTMELHAAIRGLMPAPGKAAAPGRRHGGR